jgi:hypothetical protein
MTASGISMDDFTSLMSVSRTNFIVRLLPVSLEIASPGWVNGF